MSHHNSNRNVTIQYEINPLENVTDELSKETKTSAHLKKTNLLDLTKHRFFMSFVYILLGILALLSILVIINTYVLHLKVETAVISTQIETMTAPINGYLTHMYASSGAYVKKGDPLFKIESINLERELRLARVQSSESKLNIDYYQQLLSNEQQRLKIYQKIGSNRVVSAQSHVNSSLQNVANTQHNLDRLIKLNQKHYISDALLEAGRTKYVSAQEQLADAKAQHSIERYSLKSVHNGMYFTGTKTEGIMHDLEAQLIAAQRKATLDDKRVSVYEHLIKKLTVVAPFHCKVTQILKSEGNTTDTFKPIIFIEKIDAEKHIIAYLTQEEIIHIGAGKVKIYVPALGKTFGGNIVDINRTDGFVDAVNAQYRWRDFQIDRSAKVTLEVGRTDQHNFNKIAFSGMPVIVYFRKKHLLF